MEGQVLTLSEQLEAEAEESKFTVDAHQKGQPLYWINQAGDREKLADVYYRDYDNDRKLRAVLIQGVDEDKPSVLGRVSSEWKISQHVDALKPLVDLGFKPRKLFAWDHGGNVNAIFEHPDYVTQDTILWDRSMYPSTATQVGELRMAVRVKSSVQPGKATKLDFGYLRLRCVNGLITERFNYGSYWADHRHHSLRDIGPWVKESINRFTEPIENTRPAAVLNWPMDQLLLSSENKLDVETLPQWARDPVLRITTHVPKWAQTSLINQLLLLYQNGEVSNMDLVSLLTNLGNVEHKGRAGRDEGPLWVYRDLDILHSALIDVVDIGCFIEGVPPMSAGLAQPALPSPN